jgi:hypothetical protein
MTPAKLTGNRSAECYSPQAVDAKDITPRERCIELDTEDQAAAGLSGATIGQRVAIAGYAEVCEVEESVVDGKARRCVKLCVTDLGCDPAVTDHASVLYGGS